MYDFRKMSNLLKINDGGFFTDQMIDNNKTKFYHKYISNIFEQLSI